MPSRPLFIYGTLQDEAVWRAVTGRPLAGFSTRPARAPGQRAVYYGPHPYPALVPQPGAAAPGLLVFGLSMADWAALDTYEGEGYHRAILAVSTAEGPIEAQAYLPAAAPGPALRPWHLAEWLKGRNNAPRTGNDA